MNFNIFCVRAYLYSVVTEKTRKRKEIETARDYKVQSATVISILFSVMFLILYLENSTKNGHKQNVLHRVDA